MNNFNISNFLKQYKPKKIDMSAYLKLSYMQDYKWMDTHKNINKLIPTISYIRYIRVGNTNLEDGGIFIEGGYYSDSTFISSNKSEEWTHLKLKTNISKKTGKKIKSYRYIIKINNYHIFYKNDQLASIYDVILKK